MYAVKPLEADRNSSNHVIKLKHKLSAYYSVRYLKAIYSITTTNYSVTTVKLIKKRYAVTIMRESRLTDGCWEIRH